MKEPTNRQRQALDFVKQYQKSHKRSPSLHDIAKALSVGLTSAHRHVTALEQKGYIERGGHRAITIV